MVAIFFTFALSGPLPPKEMGVILGVAVLLDAALVRLVLVPVLLRLLGPQPGRCRAGSTGCCRTSALGTRELYGRERLTSSSRPLSPCTWTASTGPTSRT